MKLHYKFVLLLIITNIHFYNHAAEENIKQDLNKVKDEVNSGKTLSLGFIPQYQSYSSLIPDKIKNLFDKLDLDHLQVDYDTQASVGAISASTHLGKTEAVIRIIVGKALSSSMTYQQEFKKSLEGYQSKLKSLPKIPQKGKDLVKKGLTYMSSKSSKEDKKKALNEALKKKEEKKKESKKDKKNPSKDSTKKTSWVSEQLAGYQGGILLVLPKGFKFSTISSDLGFLDYIDLEEVVLGIGSGFMDPVYGIIPAGFSLVAKVKSNIEPFKSLTSFFNKMPGPAKMDLNQPMMLRGGIMAGIGGSSFGLALPGQLAFKFSDKTIASTDQLNIGITLLPPPEGTTGVSGLSACLWGGLQVFLKVIDSRLDTLDFVAIFSVDTSAEASLTGKMNGLLNLEPIGLPLEFGNIALTIGVNPTNIETLGLAEVGMMGELDFGPPKDATSLKAAIDLKLSGQDSNLLVYGDLEPKGAKKDAVSLKDLVNLAVSAFKDLGVHVGKFDTNIPDLGLKKASFYFSPRNTIFANKLWRSGIKVDLALDILGTEAKLECDIGPQGFEATGFLSEIDLGPLKITGAGKSKKCTINDTCLKSCDDKTTSAEINITHPNEKKSAPHPFTLDAKTAPKLLKDWTDYSKLKGAIVNLRFKPPTNIGMFVSAEVDLDVGKLGTFKTDACFDISLKGVYAHLEAKVFNILDTVFTLNAKDFAKPKDWYVCAEIRQNALSMIEKEVSKLVSAAKAEITKKIDDAEDQVASAKKAYTKAFSQAQSGIKDAQDKVDSLKKQLDDAQDKCAGHGGGSVKAYPYQKPHPFNSSYIPARYAFIGNMKIYGSSDYTATIQNKNITFKANTNHSLADDLVDISPGGHDIFPAMEKSLGFEKFMLDKNNPLIINPKNSMLIILMPQKKTLTPINILIENTNDIITTYVWRKEPKEIGYKIIFDTKKFADYVTPTYWYDHLGKGNVLGFALGLEINGDNLDITSIANKKPQINRMFHINVLMPFFNKANIPLLDISLFAKIAEKNLKVPMSYTDLFFGQEKVLQILPTNKNDLSTMKTFYEKDSKEKA